MDGGRDREIIVRLPWATPERQCVPLNVGVYPWDHREIPWACVTPFLSIRPVCNLPIHVDIELSIYGKKQSDWRVNDRDHLRRS